MYALQPQRGGISVELCEVEKSSLVEAAFVETASKYYG